MSKSIVPGFSKVRFDSTAEAKKYVRLDLIVNWDDSLSELTNDSPLSIHGGVYAIQLLTRGEGSQQSIHHLRSQMLVKQVIDQASTAVAVSAALRQVFD